MATPEQQSVRSPGASGGDGTQSEGVRIRREYPWAAQQARSFGVGFAAYLRCDTNDPAYGNRRSTLTTGYLIRSTSHLLYHESGPIVQAISIEPTGSAT